MVKGSIGIPMDVIIKDCFMMHRDKAKEYIIIQMVIDMKVSSQMTCIMGKVHWHCIVKV